MAVSKPVSLLENLICSLLIAITCSSKEPEDAISSFIDHKDHGWKSDKSSNDVLRLFFWLLHKIDSKYIAMCNFTLQSDITRERDQDQSCTADLWADESTHVRDSGDRQRCWTCKAKQMKSTSETSAVYPHHCFNTFPPYSELTEYSALYIQKSFNSISIVTGDKNFPCFPIFFQPISLSELTDFVLFSLFCLVR